MDNYPLYVDPDRRTTSVISSLLYRCAIRGWDRQCCLELAQHCDRYGDALGALYWLREARRAPR